jgi:lactoylglutathione lyase
MRSIMRKWKSLLIATLILPGSLALAQTGSAVGKGSSILNSSAISAVIDHAALHVRDVETSARFYQTVLSFARTPDPFKDSQHVWLLIGPHQQLHLIGGATQAASQDDDVHLAFRVADVAAFSTHLDRLQVTHKPYGTRADGVKQVYFQDPDGYWLEVNDAKF